MKQKNKKQRKAINWQKIISWAVLSTLVLADRKSVV